MGAVASRVTLALSGFPPTPFRPARRTRARLHTDGRHRVYDRQRATHRVCCLGVAVGDASFLTFRERRLAQLATLPVLDFKRYFYSERVVHASQVHPLTTGAAP